MNRCMGTTQHLASPHKHRGRGKLLSNLLTCILLSLGQGYTIDIHTQSVIDCDWLMGPIFDRRLGATKIACRCHVMQSTPATKTKGHTYAELVDKSITLAIKQVVPEEMMCHNSVT